METPHTSVREWQDVVNLKGKSSFANVFAGREENRLKIGGPGQPHYR